MRRSNVSTGSKVRGFGRTTEGNYDQRKLERTVKASNLDLMETLDLFLQIPYLLKVN